MSSSGATLAVCLVGRVVISPSVKRKGLGGADGQAAE